MGCATAEVLGALHELSAGRRRHTRGNIAPWAGKITPEARSHYAGGAETSQSHSLFRHTGAHVLPSRSRFVSAGVREAGRVPLRCESGGRRSRADHPAAAGRPAEPGPAGQRGHDRRDVIQGRRDDGLLEGCEMVSDCDDAN